MYPFSSKNASADKNHALAAEQPGHDRSGGAPDSGAHPSNTAPSTCINSPIRILHRAIDTLRLSYPGQLSYEAQAILNKLKAAARSSGSLNQAEAIYCLGDHRFEVKKAGRGRFPFVLTDNAYRIELSGAGADQLPLAVVQVRSEWLLSNGVTRVYKELSELIASFGQVGGDARVSRGDICVDFASDLRLDDLPAKAWVSRARRASMHTVDRGFTGWSIGLGGDISARLYDKTKEVVEVGKDYMWDIWRASGWNGEQTVWRVEFEYWRSFLKARGIEGVESFLDQIGSLWRYSTESWLRLTVPSYTDRTQSRWPSHPVWDALCRVEWSGTSKPLPVPSRCQRMPNEQYMYSNALAGLISHMAVHAIWGSREAFDSYYEAVRRFHDARCAFTGEDLESFLRLKAAIKAKEYNLPYPGVDERVGERILEASVEAYRRARDG